jgi:putative component of membrane protein insertase Oxa1/YidC/SpoIIIJ protein YidD
MPRCIAVAAAAVAILAPGSGAALAAVRLCKPTVDGGFVTGDTEMGARKAALDGWKAKALAHGEEYASWRLAADKLLHCLPGKSGGYECIARAAPCTIDQAPARRELRSKRLGI